MTHLEPTTDLPSEVADERHWFDDVADAASHHVATGPFFAVTSALLAGWAVVGWLVTGFTDRWLNIGSSTMVVITFALLAILENAQRRSDKALHRKLNVLAQAVAELLERDGECTTADELRGAAGVEHRESTL